MAKQDGEGSGELGLDLDEATAGAGQNVVSIGGKQLPRAEKESPRAEVPLYVFGAIPGDATYWAAHKAGLGGTWGVLSWGAPGSSAELREWPLADLSEEEIARRWGPGTYKLQWLKASPNGGRKSISYGRVFTLRPIEAAALPPALVPAPASALGETFVLATQIMNMIEHNADRKVEGYAAMARLMQPASNGLGAAELTLILQRQAESTREMVASLVSPLQRELADLRASRDEPSGGGVVAAAAGLVKGGGMGAQILNYAAANPEIVKTVLPVVSEMVGKLAGIFTPPAPPKFIARATPEMAAAAASSAPLAAAALAPQSLEPTQHAPGSISSWETRTPAPLAPAPEATPAGASS